MRRTPHRTWYLNVRTSHHLWGLLWKSQLAPQAIGTARNSQRSSRGWRHGHWGEMREIHLPSQHHVFSFIFHISMDWFKGNFTGKPHSSWQNLWFPANFPLNQSIEHSRRVETQGSLVVPPRSTIQLHRSSENAGSWWDYMCLPYYKPMYHWASREGARVTMANWDFWEISQFNGLSPNYTVYPLVNQRLTMENHPCFIGKSTNKQRPGTRPSHGQPRAAPGALSCQNWDCLAWTSAAQNPPPAAASVAISPPPPGTRGEAWDTNRCWLSGAGRECVYIYIYIYIIYIYNIYIYIYINKYIYI